MMKEENDISYNIIGSAYEVHSELGPGLLESTYEVCLEKELKDLGYEVERQKPLPVIYKGIEIEAGYRIDLLVNNLVLVELKAVDVIQPIHHAQVLTYLKLLKLKLGLLINFNTLNLQRGIKRLIKSKNINLR